MKSIGISMNLSHHFPPTGGSINVLSEQLGLARPLLQEFGEKTLRGRGVKNGLSQIKQFSCKKRGNLECVHTYIYIYTHIIVIIIYIFIIFIYHSYHSYTFIIYIYLYVVSLFCESLLGRKKH